MLKVSFQWKNSDKICLCSHWAAGEILPPFLHFKGRVAAVAAKVVEVATSRKKLTFGAVLLNNLTKTYAKLCALFLYFPLR